MPATPQPQRKLSYPKNKIRVLLLENIHPEAVTAFQHESYQIETLPKSLSEDELIAKIKDVQLLGIRSNTFITERVLEAANRLQAIGAFCIGTNQIDLTTTAQHGVAVFNAPYSNTRSVVELVVSEMIALGRGLMDKNRQMHAGVWDKSAVGSHEIRGRKLGIIGYGNIGSQLSVLAESLGLQVYFFDTTDKLVLGNAIRCESMEDLLRQVDIISIHVDGKPENNNFFSKRDFKQMKPGALFLNLSRGMVIDIDALKEHLVSGHLAGAAIDVFPKEPKSKDEPFESPLQGLPNVILTPHVGGSTEEAQYNIGRFVSSKLISFINTGDTSLSVNLPNLALPAQSGAHRLIHIHRNEPGTLAKITAILAECNANIEGQYLGTRGNVGYVITDINAEHDPEAINALKNMGETIRLRVLY